MAPTIKAFLILCVALLSLGAEGARRGLQNADIAGLEDAADGASGGGTPENVAGGATGGGAPEKAPSGATGGGAPQIAAGGATLENATGGGAPQNAAGGGIVVDVTKHDAKADGQTESAQALIRAWNEACKSSGPAKLVIPPGKFMAGEVVFAGPCTAKPVTIELQGTLLARSDLSLFTRNTWISVENVDGLEINGGGTFNGQGELSWKHSDKSHDTENRLPDSVVFSKVANAVVRDVNFVNSKGFHMKITSGSQNFRVQNLTITAPGDSPNTDGIHISKSQQVNITETKIGTGDDCISIGDGNTDVFVSKIECGPGHGISIGSLGKRETETDLKGVTVTNCTLTGTTNGARIKSYRASPKLQASGIVFEDIIMNQVQNPIIIDQNYNSKNKAEGSNVKLSDVHFRNIRGTSATGVAVALHCSESNPCEGVELADIDFTLCPTAKGGPISSACENAKATFTGKQNPAGCGP